MLSLIFSINVLVFDLLITNPKFSESLLLFITTKFLWEVFYRHGEMCVVSIG